MLSRAFVTSLNDYLSEASAEHLNASSLLLVLRLSINLKHVELSSRVNSTANYEGF